MMLGRVAERAIGLAQRAVERRLRRVEAAISAAGGVDVERQGPRLILSGRRLGRRWIEDVRLRFAGRTR